MILSELLFDFGRQFQRQPPHSNVAATGDGRGQAADVGENPPIGVALVPDAAFAGESGVPGDTIHRVIIHCADDAARPRLNLVPFEKMCKGRRIGMFRQPNDKILVFLPAELLGNAHRATPPRRNRHHAAVLHTLQSRHDQDGVCSGASKGVKYWRGVSHQKGA